MGLAARDRAGRSVVRRPDRPTTPPRRGGTIVWRVRRTRRGIGWAAAGLMVVAVTASLSSEVSGATAAPPAAPTTVGIDGHPARDADNRPGRAAPNLAQLTQARRFGAVRWNAF